MGSCAPCAYSLREETGGFPSRMGSLSLPSLFYNISDIQFCDLLDVWFPKGQALVSLGLWHQAQQHLRCSGMLAAGVLRTPLSNSRSGDRLSLWVSAFFSPLYHEEISRNDFSGSFQEPGSPPFTIRLLPSAGRLSSGPSCP